MEGKSWGWIVNGKARKKKTPTTAHPEYLSHAYAHRLLTLTQSGEWGKTRKTPRDGWMYGITILMHPSSEEVCALQEMTCINIHYLT